MLRKILTIVLMLAATAVYAQEYKVVTTVESVVPGGAGRSRIIENTQQMDSELLTTSRTKGTKSNQGDVKRKSAKIDKLNETKLLNFYSVLGINFQNIASNDAIMTSTINALAQEGWELVFVTSGVESDAGEVDRQGIFITRYIFRRN